MLRTIAWIICIVYATIPAYWLIVHPRAARWAEKGGIRLMSIGPAWLLMWLAVGAITWRWRLTTLYDLRWPWIPGAMLILSGLVIYAFARQNFTTDQVLGRSELQPHKHEQRLVAGGIRAHVRHPYYLGHLCELVGWTIATGLVVLYGLLAVGVISGYVMVRAEERELEARFGNDYRQYRARSAAMFPGLW